MVGVAVGGSHGAFSIPDVAATGGHIGLYDLAAFERFYGASNRSAAGFGGLTGETEDGMFASSEFRSRLEFGRPFDAYGGICDDHIWPRRTKTIFQQTD